MRREEKRTKLTTRCLRSNIASMNCQVHLQNVSGSTPPAREHKVFCPVHNFMNINVQSKCSSWPSTGRNLVITNMLHNARNTSIPHPKKLGNLRPHCHSPSLRQGLCSKFALLSTVHHLLLVEQSSVICRLHEFPPW